MVPEIAILRKEMIGAGYEIPEIVVRDQSFLKCCHRPASHINAALSAAAAEKHGLLRLAHRGDMRGAVRPGQVRHPGDGVGVGGRPHGRAARLQLPGGDGTGGCRHGQHRRRLRSDRGPGQSGGVPFG